MSDEIKKEEGVDFSHYYDNQAGEFEKRLTMAQNAATMQMRTKSRKKIIILVSIFVMLALLEIGLLWYGTLGEKTSVKSNIPAGYVPQVSPNGMPYYKKQ